MSEAGSEGSEGQLVISHLVSTPLFAGERWLGLLPLPGPRATLPGTVTGGSPPSTPATTTPGHSPGLLLNLQHSLLHLPQGFPSGPDSQALERPSSQPGPQGQVADLPHRVPPLPDPSRTDSLAPFSHSQAYVCQTSRTCLVSRGSCPAQAGRPNKCQNPSTWGRTQVTVQRLSFIIVGPSSAQQENQVYLIRVPF